jgi:hypothetical protein
LKWVTKHGGRTTLSKEKRKVISSRLAEKMGGHELIDLLYKKVLQCLELSICLPGPFIELMRIHEADQSKL